MSKKETLVSSKFNTIKIIKDGKFAENKNYEISMESSPLNIKDIRKRVNLIQLRLKQSCGCSKDPNILRWMVGDIVIQHLLNNNKNK